MSKSFKQGVSTHWEAEEASFSHKMTLNISFSKLLSKDSSGSYEDLTQEPMVLVPVSFQSCIIEFASLLLENQCSYRMENR